MRPADRPQMESDETAFLATAVVVALLIVPMWGEGRGRHLGAIAMIVTAGIALPMYVLLFRKRLRARGELKAWAIAAAVIPALVVGVAIAAWLV